MDGKAGAEYDEIYGWRVVFSDDGAHWLYWARRGDKWLAVVDGEEGKPYDRIIKTWRPFEADSTVDYMAVKEGTLYRVTHRLSSM